MKANQRFAAFWNVVSCQLLVAKKIIYKTDVLSIDSWEKLELKLNPLPASGIRVLELNSDRKADSKWRKENLDKLAESL